MKTIANTFADGVAQALGIRTQQVEREGQRLWEAVVTIWGRDFITWHEVRRAAVLQLAGDIFGRERYHDPASAR